MAYTELEERIFGARPEQVGRVLSGAEKDQVRKLFEALQELPVLADSSVDQSIVNAVQNSFTSQVEAGPVSNISQIDQAQHGNADADAQKPSGLDNALTADQTRQWLEELQAA